MSSDFNKIRQMIGVTIFLKVLKIGKGTYIVLPELGNSIEKIQSCFGNVIL